MTHHITELLAQIEAPGTFATRLRAPADALEIEVTGVGPLKFPITPGLARKLHAVARPSPFGLGEQTLHDVRVRNTREVARSRVKIAARPWKPVLASHLRTLQADLGLPEDCELEAVFDKLLIYEEGQFFKPHQDSEKDDEMVGTLVVILPSEYEGGAVTVEHRGEKMVFRRVKSQATELSLLAFYADCFHAVSPIKSGVRVALTYQLRVSNRSKAVRPKVRADLVERLAAGLREHFAVPVTKLYSQSKPAPPERFVFLLDHEYTQRSLSWTHLKNGDRARVEALRTAAERLDCECFLALAEVHETWLCEYDYRPDRYRRRGWRAEEEDNESEPESYALLDLEDSVIELNHWLDATSQLIGGHSDVVGNEELCFTRSSHDMTPFKSEHEGYQGNYGNTVDRWYHRAALVMWPRANTFALRAQMSPQWALDELMALPRANTAELEARVRTLLPRWGRTARDGSAPFFAKLIRLSSRMADPALVSAWLAPLDLQHFTSKQMRQGLAALVDKHGLPWATELIAQWATLQHWDSPPWAPVLADLCANLQATKSTACEALAHWLLERELKIAQERCVAAFAQQGPWLAQDSFDEAKHLAHVLAAAAAMSAHKVISDTLGALLSSQPSPPTSFLVQLLQACIARSPELRARVTGSALQRECAARLGAALRTPVRAEGDWTITYPLACACEDCKTLAEFLGSAHTNFDWPLNQERRQHIHQTLDAAHLPVRHTTIRRGRPYILQLRKDRSLFSREQAYRVRVKGLLDALPAVRSR